MTDFYLGVVAHVDRQQQMRRLSEQLSPDVIEPDNGTRGASGNHLATIQALHRRHPYSWIVVMEDDAQPVEDFNTQCAAALAAAPSDIVSFYTGTGYPFQYQAKFAEAVKSDSCWLMHPQLRHGVCYALNWPIRKALITRLSKLVEQKWAPDDAIGKWAVENRVQVAYSNPSLVDHEDGKPVVNMRLHMGKGAQPAGRKMPRKAYQVGTRRTWDDSSVRVVGP